MSEASEGSHQSHATQSSGFSKEEMQALQCMIAQLETSSTITSSAFARSGITRSAFSVHSYNDRQPWIIESGASDHNILPTISHFIPHVLVGIKLESSMGHYQPYMGKVQLNVPHYVTFFSPSCA